MAKFYSVPAFNKFEDVLDLLTNTEKYTAYLTELKALHDSVTERAEGAETREKADQLLTDASNKLKDADQYAAHVREEANGKLRDAEAKALILTASAEAKHFEVQHVEHSLRTANQKLAADRKVLEDKLELLTLAQSRLTDDQAKLATDREILDAKVKDLADKQQRLAQVFA